MKTDKQLLKEFQAKCEHDYKIMIDGRVLSIERKNCKWCNKRKEK